jgi:hypothetical protein
MALPVLPHTADARVTSERVNVLIRKHNRPDLFTPSYAVDTGTGAAYAITPSADIRFYEVGQIYTFEAANANTSATPTLNVMGLGAGTITKIGGAALVPGDIPANGFVAVQVTSTTPTFQLLSPTAFSTNGATTFLGSNVGFSSSATFFNGPNTGSIGASGQKWLIIASATMVDNGAASHMVARIWDGTNDLINGQGVSAAATQACVVTLAVAVTLTGPTTFTLQGADQSTTTAGMLTSAILGAANKASSITAVRLA